ncbi:MAG: sigma-70 family RNA polymerase sigma factor [Bacteroides sp.]|nr:sigma-70 family RNA polymerase sigma factor [Eubacterium sp.]MCM1417508.1 sigma-70 family RNA polymerase sigma factor [Roseburia sp.]MCM1462543.1 sigma-70 family RNA polymerase sigma factor [Bacteroides sp.]
MTELSLITRESFDEVMRAYADMVYRLAVSRTGNPADAEDLLQEVFLRYIRADKTYRDEEHRKAWLLRATINCAKSLHTSAWSRHREASASEATLNNEGREDERLREIETKSEVYGAVLKLPERYRVAIHLFYYEDLSVARIAKLLGIGESAVKSRLARARAILKDLLQEDLFE